MRGRHRLCRAECEGMAATGGGGDLVAVQCLTRNMQHFAILGAAVHPMQCCGTLRMCMISCTIPCHAMLRHAVPRPPAMTT